MTKQQLKGRVTGRSVGTVMRTNGQHTKTADCADTVLVNVQAACPQCQVINLIFAVVYTAYWCAADGKLQLYNGITAWQGKPLHLPFCHFL